MIKKLVRYVKNYLNRKEIKYAAIDLAYIIRDTKTLERATWIKENYPGALPMCAGFYKTFGKLPNDEQLGIRATK